MRRWHLYFGVSAALHAAVGLTIVARPAPRRPMQIPLQVAVVDRDPPKLPAADPPPPPPPPAPRAQPKPRVLRSVPPPPTMKAPEPTPEPEVTSGISPDNTDERGSFAVPTGNTLYAQPPAQAAEPEHVKPYAAEKYAPAASLSELPRLIAQPDLRRFYPQEAKRKEREGSVVLRLWLDAEGAVTRAELVSNPGDGLGEAALRAARELRFSPAKLQGQPVATSVPFTLHFVLR